MNPTLVNILVFIAVFLGVFAANAVLVDLRKSDRKRLRQRLEEQLLSRHRRRLRAAEQHRDFSQLAANAFADTQNQRGLFDKLKELIEQSGLEISVTHVLVSAAGLAIVAGIPVGWLMGSPLLGCASAAVGAAMPILYVNHKRLKRLRDLREQLPDAFELMARVMRAGQTIAQAMQAVAEEFEQPIRLEFLLCYEQMNLGLPQEAALRDLSRRTGLLEIKIYVLSVLVHRQTGGNLAELLDKLAYVVRERFRISGMIQSLTAQGRLQAGILMCLPPGMFAMLYAIQPSYQRVLFDYPMLLATVAGLMAAGWLWIRKIVNFDF